MKIVFLSQEYAPEEISSAILMQELAEDLVRRGHRVTVVTRAPNYPLGIIFPGYQNKIYQSENLNGVDVIRVWSHITPRKEFWHRIFAFGSFSFSAFYGGLFCERPDLVVSYSPPLPLSVSAWLLARIWRVPWVMRIEDLFPEAAVAAGVLTNQASIKFFASMADFLYLRADHISLITERFHEILRKKPILEHKISVIPVWADPDIVLPMPKENNFRARYGLLGKFVIMYAGVLGLTSAIEDLAQAALILKECTEIKFVVVGEGIKKEWLMNFVQENKLTNMLILPFQPRMDFPQMMAAADVNLATLNKALSDFSLPHKIFNIMASERPILVIAPMESDLANLIKNGDCGLVVPIDQPALLAHTILDLRANQAELSRLGGNGRELLLKTYARQICISRFEDLFYCVSGKMKTSTQPF